MGRGGNTERGHDRGHERRHNNRGEGGPPGLIKRIKMERPQHPEQRVFDRIRNLDLNELVPQKFEVKKFMANTRLYVGNIANDVTDDEVKEIFKPYGELDELFVNREKNFAFLKLDFRTSAEKARAEVDGMMLKNRALKVRFAPASVRIKVKNLPPTVTNELLEFAFSVFGDVERALVFVDEKGKSVGEGIVDFTRKNNAVMAHRFCSDWCYFLSSDLRPVETELAEMYEMDEGLPEANFSAPQRAGFKGRQEHQNFVNSRQSGPRVAEEGSFDHEYGMKWKALIAEHKQKEQELKAELQLELENLYKKMEIERYEYETEKLREQLRQRELDAERHRMEWEQRERMRRDREDGFGRQFGGRGPSGSRFSGYQTVGSNQGGPEVPVDNMMMDDNDATGSNGSANFLGINFSDVAGGSLAPPPMPPPSLLDVGVGGASSEQDVKWELGPFATAASFDQQEQQQQGMPAEDIDQREENPGREQIMRDRPRFADRGGSRGGGGHRGGYNRGGGRGPYRGGGRIPRR